MAAFCIWVSHARAGSLSSGVGAVTAANREGGYARNHVIESSGAIAGEISVAVRVTSRLFRGPDELRRLAMSQVWKVISDMVKTVTCRLVSPLLSASHPSHSPTDQDGRELIKVDVTLQIGS